jgi:hypothetical protein
VGGATVCGGPGCCAEAAAQNTSNVRPKISLRIGG